MEFKQRLVVITGGAGGIARETAPLLLAAGAQLLLIDRTPRRSRRSRPSSRRARGCGRRSRRSRRRRPAPPRSTASSGRSTRWSISPGSSGPTRWRPPQRPLWDATIAANLTNAFDMAAAVGPRLDPAVTCRMVFASSLAFRRGSFDHIAYTAAKGGIVGLVRALARGAGAARCWSTAWRPGSS